MLLRKLFHLISMLSLLGMLNACSDDTPQATAFTDPVKEADIIAPKVLVIEEITGISADKPNLQDDLKKSVILGATRVKDIHVFMSKSFDPKTRQSFQGADVYSLRSSVIFDSRGNATIKVVLFEESAQRINRKVEKDSIKPDELRQTFETAIRIALGNLSSSS